MTTVILLCVADAILINVGFIMTFFIRYGRAIPDVTLPPYKNSFVFLTLIYMVMLAGFGVYKKRFKSSWSLFKRVSLGLSIGTLLSVAFVYVFRIKWGAFPTSVFAISFFVNLILIFKFNQFVLRIKKRIKMQVSVLAF